ncbi:aminopeptidase P family protein [Enterococcus sp. DIV0242_7C1]|uniref:Proline dipeptidase n=1 Tax=Candidatus Enterococcus dunnyi TaxID=1834192 RepID=A0A200J8G7_9ENTE|nr:MULTISPECIES: Xaa-Pro peptidase family protein [unclassified Enterococcus]MBO0471926.1 aminopeptidase P family protein [Enterococcus sp. DIV0242_7C1]OUZ33523.1 proline dipeptidase [Enterococcus sp. 9D6_DIV0238]
MNQEKINDLKKWMEKEQIDLTYISDPGHIAYFSGYHSDPHERVLALFISLNSGSFLFTPALEVEDAENSSWSEPVYGYLDSEDPWEKITQLIKKNGNPLKIATEKEALSVSRFERLNQAFPSSDFSISVTPVIEKLQLLKTPAEVNKLMEAGNWADVALEIGFKAITEGAKEQEILAEIEYQLKRQGIRSMSFDTLVLTGKNAASPHGNPGNTAVAKQDLVLFDLGVVYNGYCSDVTRTVAYKEPTDFQKEIYSIVLEAQLKAMDAVKPGVTAGELDDVARGVISGYGYGEYFNHRLGHGIGTTVHEYPSLVTGNDLVIEEGMCFSIEPGIYIPGKVGVRIEDCLHVTKTGCEAFTKTTKELQIID